MDTACDILDLNAIQMLKYRTRKKIDWACPGIARIAGPKAGLPGLPACWLAWPAASTAGPI